MTRHLLLATLFSIATLGTSLLASPDDLYIEEIPESKSETTTENNEDNKEDNTPNNRLYFSGLMGFSFGSDYTSITLAPQGGYFLTKWLVVGGGVNYNMYKDKYSGYTGHWLGINAFVRAYALKYITFQIQPEVFVNWWSAGVDVPTKLVPTIVAGAGVDIPVAPYNYLSIMIYYDLLENLRSPYGGNLFYSIGYSFRF